MKIPPRAGLWAIAALFCLEIPTAGAFGVDVCFNAPESGDALIRNCIGVEQVCRTSNLGPSNQVACRGAALADSMSGLTGTNDIIGGRSLLHSDSTYLMAQLIGYTPWQAYQVMIYDEATDQSDYFPFDQNGQQMLDDTQIAQCRSAWGSRTPLPRECLVITRVMNGIYKFNDEAGGMLLHLHARYSPTGRRPPNSEFPTDYFSETNAQYELLVNNMRDWAFDRRPDACVAGVVERKRHKGTSSVRCEAGDHVIKSPQNFFAAGVSFLQIPFSSNLGTLIVNQDESKTVKATNRSLQAYITPHEMNFAKLGMFLHTLADRFSHHLCTDRSWFEREASGDYDSHYDQITCAQGSHFLWHAWEQGTEQDTDNLEPQYQTLRPALEAVYQQLLESARLRGLPVNEALDEEALIDQLVDVLGIYDSQSRLDAMVALMEELGALPLPGHGSAADLSITQWLDAAGAPRHR